MNNDRQPFRIGYVIKMFPRLSETFILNEILELERLGVEVTIFSLKKPNEGRFHPQLTSLQARVLYLEDLDPKKWTKWISEEWPTLSQMRDSLWLLMDEAIQSGDANRADQVWQAAWVASQARKLNLNHFHAHFASLPSTIAYYAHRISSIPYSFTAHAKDIFVYTADEHQLSQKLVTATPVVTVTEFNRTYLLGQTANPNDVRLRVIHNGINLEYFRPDTSISREKNLILTVGRLVPKKGIDTLIMACDLMRNAAVPFRCVIAGTGPEEASLIELTRSLGFEAEVELVGSRNLEEVRVLMNRSAIFCLPCRVTEDNNQDALPTVLLEALACELPCISTSISGIPEIIDSGIDGSLVEPDNPQALATELTRLLQSDELRKKYGANGRRKVLDKFDLRKNVQTLLAAFRQAGAPSAAQPAGVAGRQVAEV
ncbi:MAG: glycosyltransferase family 4 protein [Candidatus Zixiibacteriota bacterium]